MTAPVRLHTDEEQAFWDSHDEYLAHMWLESPCADCVRGNCRTARLLDMAADEAGRAWGRKTGGWW